MYRITLTICMAHYALYTTSHPCFMTSQPSTHDIKATLSHITPIISESTSMEFVSSHRDYGSLNPHFMYDITVKVCIAWYEIHTTSRPLCIVSHRSMISHPMYSWHHTQYIWYRIHWGCVITYSVLFIPQLPYGLYRPHSMYDIIWILCDITPTLYDITKLYSWQPIHSIHDITRTVFDITYTVLVTSQPR